MEEATKTPEPDVQETAKQEKQFPCMMPNCTRSGPAREMFSLDRHYTGHHNRVVVCKPCKGFVWATRKVKAFPLTYSLKWEQEREEKLAFLRTVLKEPSNASRNGKPNRREPQMKIRGVR